MVGGRHSMRRQLGASCVPWFEFFGVLLLRCIKATSQSTWPQPVLGYPSGEILQRASRSGRAAVYRGL